TCNASSPPSAATRPRPRACSGSNARRCIESSSSGNATIHPQSRNPAETCCKIHHATCPRDPGVSERHGHREGAVRHERSFALARDVNVRTRARGPDSHDDRMTLIDRTLSLVLLASLATLSSTTTGCQRESHAQEHEEVIKFVVTRPLRKDTELTKDF